MARSSSQQAFQLIQKAQKPLLITARNPNGDGIGSLCALYLALQKIGKEASLVSPDHVPHSLMFLPGTSQIKTEIEGAREFILSLDLSKTNIKQVSYDKDERQKKLNIYIAPERGTFKPSDVASAPGRFDHDLICTVDTPDLESLGGVYDENSDFFYETPIINIDHHSSNEYFGQVNLVNITSSATAEIALSFIETIGRGLLDEEISTNLLTGIITKTQSFQSESTTPQTFSVAAKLVAAGAKQQKIIQQVYRTKSLGFLKLWGRALARLQHDTKNFFSWSMLSQEDFKKSGAGKEVLVDIVTEIKQIAPGDNLTLLLAEVDPSKILGIILVGPRFEKEKIQKLLTGTIRGDFIFFYPLKEKIPEAEKEVIEKLKQLSGK